MEMLAASRRGYPYHLIGTVNRSLVLWVTGVNQSEKVVILVTHSSYVNERHR